MVFESSDRLARVSPPPPLLARGGLAAIETRTPCMSSGRRLPSPSFLLPPLTPSPPGRQRLGFPYALCLCWGGGLQRDLLESDVQNDIANDVNFFNLQCLIRLGLMRVDA